MCSYPKRIYIIPSYLSNNHYLQDNVKQLKSYVKDNTDFINKIEQQEKIQKESFLILIDVRSLCRNTPHKKGIQAVKESLEKNAINNSNQCHRTFLTNFLT